MMKRIDKIKAVKIAAVALGAVAVALIVYMLYWGVTTTEVTVGSDKTIAVTPEKVIEIKQIGQWEFLSVVDEQVVDTIRRNRIMPDDRLACIYYGNLRLGIDLTKAPEHWVINHNDTVTVTLPSPGLLDDDFIDEARTIVFYERGNWSPYVRDRMYRTAKRRMKQYALTPTNLSRVQDAATERFESIFRSLGAKEVIIEFEEPSEFAR